MLHNFPSVVYYIEVDMAYICQYCLMVTFHSTTEDHSNVEDKVQGITYKLALG